MLYSILYLYIYIRTVAVMADVKDFNVLSTVDGKFLMYKGLPLVREDNVICYGSMDED